MSRGAPLFKYTVADAVANSTAITCSEVYVPEANGCAEDTIPIEVQPAPQWSFAVFPQPLASSITTMARKTGGGGFLSAMSSDPAVFRSM